MRNKINKATIWFCSIFPVTQTFCPYSVALLMDFVWPAVFCRSYSTSYTCKHIFCSCTFVGQNCPRIWNPTVPLQQSPKQCTKVSYTVLCYEIFIRDFFHMYTHNIFLFTKKCNRHISNFGLQTSCSFHNESVGALVSFSVNDAYLYIPGRNESNLQSHKLPMFYYWTNGESKLNSKLDWCHKCPVFCML